MREVFIYVLWELFHVIYLVMLFFKEMDDNILAAIPFALSFTLFLKFALIVLVLFISIILAIVFNVPRSSLRNYIFSTFIVLILIFWHFYRLNYKPDFIFAITNQYFITYVISIFLVGVFMIKK